MTAFSHHQKKQETVLSPTFRFIIPAFPYFNIYSYIKMPPLGIMSVAKSVDRMEEFKVEVIDENNYNGQLDHVRLQKERPAKYVGFYGGLTSTIPRLLEVAEIYKNNGATVIAGGNHVDVKSEETLSGSTIDIIVNGEGEITIQDLLKTIEENKELSAIDGITYKIDGKIIKTKRRPPIDNLEQIEPPDFTLLHNLPKPLKYIPLNMTRGCNHSCEFCIVKHHLGRSRSFPVKTIVKEYLKYCDMGVREFFFTDDNFAQFPEKTKQLCEEITEYRSRMKKKPELTVQVRVDSAENSELLKIMREAGVKTLCIGYESPLDEELINMKKNLTVDGQKKYTKILKKEGFYIHGMFIFGYPTFLHSKKKVEIPLKERAKKYLHFIKKNNIDTIQILLPVPIPGTKLESKLNDEGRLFPTEIVNWDKYDGNWLCFRPDKGLSPKEFQYWGNWVMKKFY
ncbi:B12-binding domain-containing radical SAM protein, partial [bacterium]|nr:B12-binding domain-containing radical SAM protein [bacterium]